MTDRGVFIRSIGSQLATDLIDNVAQGERFGKDAEFITSRIGALSLPVRSSGESACSLAGDAARKALATADLHPSEIGLLIFVTQNADLGGLPHNAAILHGSLGLPTSAMAFDLGLGCSGFVYGLSVASALMTSSGIQNALLVTSDQYRGNLAADDINTNLLFGDGACATVLSREGDFEIRAGKFGTDGTGYEGLIRNDAGIMMNGRAIFNFSRITISNAIVEFCGENGLPLESVDEFLLHQGSRAIVEEIAKKLGVDEARVPVEIETTGNLVSSSIPALLERRLADRNRTRLILAGFGVGLSWGTVWLERNAT